ncbi:MAG: chromosomal replication initiator protein DnaA [Planctomycetota bacterium]
MDAAIREGVGSNVYGLWFHSLVYSLSGDTLSILCPSSTHRDQLEQRYSDLIVKTAGRHIGFNPRLDFKICESNHEELPAPARIQETRKTRKASTLKSCDVHPGHSFERFVVGPDNQIAYASCLAIAQETSRQYNPLFLHGPTGLGKTHLLQSTYNHLCQHSSHLNVLYTNCEAFTNEFIASIRDHSLNVFRDMYRRVDVLLMDDVQFLADKTSTQEEFFHTFNDLILADKRVLLSSDSAPHELQKFESRLISRFSSGLVTSIQPPGYETRLSLIRHKSKHLNLQLEPTIEQAIAALSFSNVRELHGALVTLEAHIRFSGQPATLETISKIAPNSTHPAPGFDVIVDIICREFGVTLTDLQSKKRPNSIAHPRQLAMFLLREHTNKSLHEIGVFFGGRDHSTVQYAHSKISKDREVDQSLNSVLRRLEESLGRSCG